MMLRHVIFLLLMLLANVHYGQVLQQNIFPQLEGQDLFDKVINTYKTKVVLDYGDARDTLYSKIDAKNDTLECIYTGMRNYLDPSQDPTQAAFNGPGGGINAEHSYPQSKGASGLGRSDMHHLYPTRVAANSARMSNPMAEIPDNETDSWYRLDFATSSIPSVNRDLYSEASGSRFEPRESVKGNIARSIFYFYTMYQDQADIADPLFFGIQMPTLCNWHNADPVDQIEWKRSWDISRYQENKPNPFVIDCSLVSRMYCDNIDQACEEYVRLVSTTDDNESANVSIYPNPAHDILVIKNTTAYRLTLLDTHGHSYLEQAIQEPVIMLALPTSMGTGIYFLKLEEKSGASTYTKVVVIR
jgi:hypothetical protein